jgi:hypothetical protein
MSERIHNLIYGNSKVGTAPKSTKAPALSFRFNNQEVKSGGVTCEYYGTVLSFSESRNPITGLVTLEFVIYKETP